MSKMPSENVEAEKSNKPNTRQELINMVLCQANEISHALYNFKVKSREIHSKIQNDINSIKLYTDLCLTKRDNSLENFQKALNDLNLELKKVAYVTSEVRKLSNSEDPLPNSTEPNSKQTSNKLKALTSALFYKTLHIKWCSAWLKSKKLQQKAIADLFNTILRQETYVKPSPVKHKQGSLTKQTPSLSDVISEMNTMIEKLSFESDDEVPASKAQTFAPTSKPGARATNNHNVTGRPQFNSPLSNPKVYVFGAKPTSSGISAQKIHKASQESCKPQINLQKNPMTYLFEAKPTSYSVNSPKPTETLQQSLKCDPPLFKAFESQPENNNNGSSKPQAKGPPSNPRVFFLFGAKPTISESTQASQKSSLKHEVYEPLKYKKFEAKPANFNNGTCRPHFVFGAESTISEKPSLKEPPVSKAFVFKPTNMNKGTNKLHAYGPPSNPRVNLFRAKPTISGPKQASRDNMKPTLNKPVIIQNESSKPQINNLPKTAISNLFELKPMAKNDVGTSRVKFIPPTGNDSFVRLGNVPVRYQCITFIKEFENKSLEELRFEDYIAGRRGPTLNMFKSQSESSTSTPNTPTQSRESPTQAPTKKRETLTQDRKTATTQRETPTQFREVPTQKRETPTPNCETTTQFRETPTQYREAPTQKRETPTPNCETTTQFREAPTQKRETPTPNCETTTQHREAPTQKRETPTPNCETTTQFREVPTHKRETPTPNCETTTQYREAPTQKRETSTPNCETTTQFREAPTQKRETPTPNCETTTQHREAPTQKRETSTPNCETTTQFRETPTQFRETPTQFRETPTQYGEAPTQKRETSTPNCETTTQFRETPIQFGETPTQKRETPTPNCETTTQFREAPTQKRETPTPNCETTTQHREAPTQKRETSTPNCETTTQFRETPTQFRETPTQFRETPTQYGEVPTQKRETPTPNCETTTQFREAPTQKRETPTPNCETTTQYREAPTQKRETPTPNCETTTQFREAPTQKRETPTPNCETTTQHREAPTQKRETSTPNCETTTQFRETPTQFRETPTQFRETPTQYGEAPTQKRETSTPNCETTTQFRETPIQFGETPTQKRETPTPNCETTTQFREVPTQKTETSTQSCETPQYRETISTPNLRISDEDAAALERLLDDGKTEKAIKMCNDALDLDPENVLFLVYRARAYYKLNQYREALEDSQKAVSLSPNLPAIGYLIIARCSLALGQVAAGEQAIRRAIENDPSADVFFNFCREDFRSFRSEQEKVHQYISQHNYYDAVYVIDYCLAHHCPANSMMKLMKAECLAHMRKYDEARSIVIDLSLSSANLQSSDAVYTDAMYVTGLCSYYQENDELAIKHFRKVLKHDPDHEKAIKMFKLTKTRINTKLIKQKKELGNKAFNAGDWRKALDFYDEALSIDKNNKEENAKLHYNKATVFAKLYQPFNAIDACTAALQLDGNYIKALLRRAQCYNEIEMYEKSLDDYEQIYYIDSTEENKRLMDEANRALVANEGPYYYYKVLGINKTATQDDIKKAYKKCALRYHPDKHASASLPEMRKNERKFKLMKEAYELLSDPVTRANYDRNRRRNYSSDDYGNGYYGYY